MTIEAAPRPLAIPLGPDRVECRVRRIRRTDQADRLVSISFAAVMTSAVMIRRAIRLSICSVGLVLAIPFAAMAKNLYVDAANGNDAVSYAANNAQAPWRSLDRALRGARRPNAAIPGEAAQAGDVVLVTAGRYTARGTGLRYEPAFNPINNGTPANPIVIRAQGRVDLAHDCANSCERAVSGPVLGTLGRQYIHWIGFHVDENDVTIHPDTGSSVVWNSDYVTIDGCMIQGRRQTYGDNHNGVRFEDARNSVLRNCRIYDIQGAYVPEDAVWSHNGAGVMLYGSHGITIEHNEITGCGSGVFPKGSNNSGITIRFNLIHGCNKGVRVSYSGSATAPVRIYQNVIYDGVSSTPGDRGHGINLAENAAYVYVTNNTLVNFMSGINFSNDMNQSNLVIQNNIVSDANYGVWTETASVKNFSVDYQTYHAVGGWIYGPANTTNFTTWQSDINDDRHSGTADPSFVSSATRDFRLASNSPARDAGIDLLDLNGNGQTGDAVSRGAYVSGNETIGPMAGVAAIRPNPPASLTVQ